MIKLDKGRGLEDFHSVFLSHVCPCFCFLLLSFPFFSTRLIIRISKEFRVELDVVDELGNVHEIHTPVDDLQFRSVLQPCFFGSSEAVRAKRLNFGLQHVPLSR